MTRAHLNFLIACIAIVGTVSYIICVVVAPEAAITLGVGYIILLLSAPLVSRWVHRR